MHPGAILGTVSLPGAGVTGCSHLVLAQSVRAAQSRQWGGVTGARRHPATPPSESSTSLRMPLIVDYLVGTDTEIADGRGALTGVTQSRERRASWVRVGWRDEPLMNP
ncbi:hypothetical protein RHA1_ro08330 (plasmid) [Rhodococcus jostii RHA1]|uniref:Uncharacterized protein n=2 Tax=Rhodococcus TaxID=1827 RepID=Q0RZB2_RHOJR|nr:hypothetical protein RHA1_ro08330 [Rhodococcus jostii RHA1]